MTSTTWAEVRARRLVRHRLAERAGPSELLDVVSATCGIHAQVMGAAELSLAARVDGVTRQDVHDLLWEERALVKAWTLRGTLHLHPSDELPLWFAARDAVSGSAPDELEAWRDPEGVLHPALPAEQVREVRAAVLSALGERPLLRDELADEVVRRVGAAPEERLRSGFAFFLGDLCQGPPQGAKITLARPDRWLGGWREEDSGEALLEACRRFLATYGPARPADFRAWFASRAFTAADAETLFDSLSGELEAVDVEGRAAFVLAGDTAFPEPAPSVRLLPEYDVYVMGFRERDQLVPQLVREQVAAHGRGRYEGPAGVRFLLVDGIAVGLWERRKRGKRIELRVTPARRLTRARRAEVEGEAERIGTFLGLDPELVVE